MKITSVRKDIYNVHLARFLQEKLEAHYECNAVEVLTHGGMVVAVMVDEGRNHWESIVIRYAFVDELPVPHMANYYRKLVYLPFIETERIPYTPSSMATRKTVFQVNEYLKQFITENPLPYTNAKVAKLFY